ncbi:MAG: hypothetical protein ACSLFK_10560 [Gemmatimonadaceae bacterium]
MVTRDRIKDWVIDALRARGGGSSLVGVAKHIWDHHENDLREAGELFYTWQYDMRWAATKLRKEGKMRAVRDSRNLTWELT